MYRYFEFDGIKSIDKDIHVVYFPQEYFEVLTYGGRGVNVERMIPTTEDNQLEFTLMVAKMDSKNNLLPFEQHDMSELALWLISDTFKPLRFSNDMDKIYYVMTTEISPLQLDTENKGFVEISFIANTNHAFTNERIMQYRVEGERDIDVFSEQTIGEENYPTVNIKALKNTDVEIHNLGTGQKIKIKGLKKGDVLHINNEYRIIKGVDGIFDRFNREWLYLRYGSNLLRIKGDIDIEFITQFRIL